MEVAIANHFNIQKHIVIPNISWGFHIHECDLLLIKKSGYVIEVEIKRSVNDLKNDFKKKHDHSDNRIKEFYYAIPDYLYDKCIGLIPEHAGIIICKRYPETKYKNKTVNERIEAFIKRQCKNNINARKLTIEEIAKLTRLGCMRIWKLKMKLIKELKK